MGFEKFIELCKEALKEKHKYLMINRLYDEEEIVFVMKAKKIKNFENSHRWMLKKTHMSAKTSL